MAVLPYTRSGAAIVAEDLGPAQRVRVGPALMPRDLWCLPLPSDEVMRLGLPAVVTVDRVIQALPELLDAGSAIQAQDPVVAVISARLLHEQDGLTYRAT